MVFIGIHTPKYIKANIQEYQEQTAVCKCPLLYIKEDVLPLDGSISFYNYNIIRVHEYLFTQLSSSFAHHT